MVTLGSGRPIVAGEVIDTPDVEARIVVSEARALVAAIDSGNHHRIDRAANMVRDAVARYDAAVEFDLGNGLDS